MRSHHDAQNTTTTSSTSIDYSKHLKKQTDFRVLQGMRLTLLQTQYLRSYITHSIQEQDKNLRRSWQDRIVQLSQLSEQCIQLQLANTTKYLIVKLEQLIDIQQQNVDAIWPHLDDFLGYLNLTKVMILQCYRKVTLGPNIGVDVNKVNRIIQQTKKVIVQLIEKHGDSLKQVNLDKEAVNRIFSLMERYCLQMQEIIKMVGEKYYGYINGRLEAEEKRVDSSMASLKKSLLED